mgnify:CR=1 FL=1
MRLVYVVPALVLLTACGPGKLDKKIAEALIKPDYPVIVPVKVPKHSKAEKGSSDLARFETINGLLAQTGWFKIQRREEGVHGFLVGIDAPIGRYFMAGVNLRFGDAVVPAGCRRQDFNHQIRCALNGSVRDDTLTGFRDKQEIGL